MHQRRERLGWAIQQAWVLLQDLHQLSAVQGGRLGRARARRMENLMKVGDLMSQGAFLQSDGHSAQWYIAVFLCFVHVNLVCEPVWTLHAQSNPVFVLTCQRLCARLSRSQLPVPVSSFLFLL